MSTRFHRRALLKGAAVAAGAQVFGVPALLAQSSPNSKLATVVIGCMNQGKASVAPAITERLVALVDVDDNQLALSKKFINETDPSVSLSGVKTFFDYRKMFDEMAKQIDVVFVATPDHHHAPAALIAMQLGKPVYVEKPLAHSIGEVRMLMAAAKKYKVVTQLGNQGHSAEGIRALCEYIWAGAVGNVTEVHAWAPTGRGGTGGRPKSVCRSCGTTGSAPSGFWAWFWSWD